MNNDKIQIRAGKDIVAKELAVLRESVNWERTNKKHSYADIERSVDAYPFTALARNSMGELIGYVSAFSNGVFTTIIGELLVHPDYQRCGIGTALLKRIELRYPGVPLHAHCRREQQPFFGRRGFVSEEQMMCVILKSRTPVNESVMIWATG